MLGNVVGRGLPLDGNAVACGGGHLDAPVLDGRSHRVGGRGFRRHAAVVKRILEGISGLVEGSDIESVRGGFFQAFERVRSEPGFFLDHLPGVGGYVVQLAPNLVPDLALLGDVVGRGLPLDGNAVASGSGHGDGPVLDGGRGLIGGSGARRHATIVKRILEDVTGLVESVDMETVRGGFLQVIERVGSESGFILDFFPGVAGNIAHFAPYLVTDPALLGDVVRGGFPFDGNAVACSPGHVERPALDGRSRRVGEGADRHIAS